MNELVASSCVARKTDGSGVGLRCHAIMSVATVLGLLAFVVGMLVARAGARGPVVAAMVLDYWLAWPAGALCCAAVALGAWLQGRREGSA